MFWTQVGDYNPAGRLPVTFYKLLEDLPPFEDYQMEGRTYCYFRGQPLFPFGYGLSYTTFAYSNLQLSAKTIACDEALTVSADVQNVGNRAGDEAVQLYVGDPVASVPVPIWQLDTMGGLQKWVASGKLLVRTNHLMKGAYHERNDPHPV